MSIAQIAQIVDVAIIAFAFILTLIGALKGRSRGIGRQSVRTVTVIISLFVSIYLSRLVASAIMVALDGMTTEDLLLSLEGVLNRILPDGIDNPLIQLLSYVDTATLNYVLAIPLSLIITPIIFVFIFMTVSALMLIVHVIFSGIFGFTKRRNNFVTRLLGLILGALQGVAVSIFVLVPIIGLLSTATSVVETMKTEAPKADATATITDGYEEFIEPFASKGSVVFMSSCGGRLLYDTLSTVDLYGVKYQMSETVSTPAIKGYVASEGLSGMDWKSLTEENKNSITAILEALDDSTYVTALVSDILDSAATAYGDGMLRFEMEGELGTLVGAVVHLFEGIDETDLMPTLNVLCDVYFYLSDEGVLVSLEHINGDQLVEALSKTDHAGKTVLTRLIDKLNKNERTAELVVTLTKISVNVMADSFGGGSIITEEAYDNIKNGINDTLKIDKEAYETEEEYVDAISESLDATLIENGIELEPEVVETMAQHVADNYSDVDELTDQQINDVILSYYNAYVESGGEIPEIPELPDSE